VKRHDWLIPQNNKLHIDLSRNVHFDLITNERLKSILSNTDIHDYPNEIPLYNAVCGYYSLNPRNTSIGLGASEVLDRIVRILAPSTVYIVEPTFGLMPSICHNNHSPYVQIGLNSLNHINDAAGVLYISNPSGQDGSCINLRPYTENFKYVICDEVYGDFDQRFSLLHADIDNVIVVKSLSKSIGQAGMRVGFAIANDEITYLLQQYRPMYICTKTAELAVPKLIKSTRDIISRMLTTKNYLQLKYDTVPSSGNYVLFKAPNKYTETFGCRETGKLYRMALTDMETLHGCSPASNTRV